MTLVLGSLMNFTLQTSIFFRRPNHQLVDVKMSILFCEKKKWPFTSYKASFERRKKRRLKDFVFDFLVPNNICKSILTNVIGSLMNRALYKTSKLDTLYQRYWNRRFAIPGFWPNVHAHGKLSHFESFSSYLSQRRTPNFSYFLISIYIPS